MKLKHKVGLFVILILAALVLHLTSQSQLLKNEKDNISNYPVIYTKEGDVLYNVMYPYLNAMVEYTLNDSYTLISPEQPLTFYIPEPIINGSLTYDLVDTTTGKSLYSSTIKNNVIEHNKEGSIFTLTLPKLTIGLEKYVLKLTYNKDNTDVFYYQPFYYHSEPQLVENALNKVSSFYHSTFNKDKKSLKPHLMEHETAPLHHLAYANLSSDIETLIWNFKGDMIKMNEPIPRITSIDPHTFGMEIELTYTQAVRNQSTFEYWDFKEVYTIDPAEGNYVISNYERYGNTNDSPHIDKYSIYMGTGYENQITHITASDNNQYTAFIKNLDLWLYNHTTHTLTKIFSFDQLNSDYIVDNYRRHGLRILTVTDDGKVVYGIYGYMNHGVFSAYNGLWVRSYYTATQSCDNIVFIPINYDLTTLEFYMNGLCIQNHFLYMSINDVLYTIDLDTYSYTQSAQRLPMNQDLIKKNENNVLRAWQESQSKHNHNIHSLNLEHNLSKTLSTADPSEGMHLIDVLDDTIIIAEYEIKKSFERLDGTVIYPYKAVHLYNEIGELKQTLYPSDNTFYKSIQISEDYQLKVIPCQYHEKVQNNAIYSKVIFTEMESVTLVEDIRNNPKHEPLIHVTTNGYDTIIKTDALIESINERILTEQQKNNQAWVIPISFSKEQTYYTLYSNQQLVGTYKNVVDAFNASEQYPLSMVYQTKGLTRKRFGLTSEQPRSTLINEVPIIAQKPDLPRGCEVTSLSMLLTYHMGVSIDKLSLADEIEKDETIYSIEDGFIHFGDMHTGFVGDMRNIENKGIGVYCQPLINLAENYVANQVLNLTGSRFEDILSFVSEGYPVLVITPNIYNDVSDKTTQHWKTPNGIMEISYYEHCVVIVGYDEHMIYYNDPSKNKRDHRPIHSFKAGWNAQGRQALVIYD